MSDAPATPDPIPDAADACFQAALQRQVDLLEQLAQAGLRLALTIEGEAAAAAAAGEPVREDAAMAFSRVARAVRLTAMLQSRLIEGPEAPRAAGGRPGALAEADDDGPAPPPNLYVPAQERRGRQVRGIVRRLAEDAGMDRETVERLDGEAAARMKRDDIYGLVRSHPFGDLVAFICAELGLQPDWARLAKEAWQETEVAAETARWTYHLTQAARRKGRRGGRPATGPAHDPAQAAAAAAALAARFAPPLHGSS